MPRLFSIGKGERKMFRWGEHLEALGNGVSVLVNETHHFGTDTILLADFCLPVKGKQAAELGAGCGAISMIWLREQPPAHITAVEIQEEAVDLLRRTVKYNEKEELVTVLREDLRQLQGKLPMGAMDLVACNPPYKTVGAGLVNAEEGKRIARHEVVCTIEDVCLSAAGLLKYGGSLCLCHRVERMCDVIEAMREAGLEPKRMRLVQQRAEKPAKLFLLEGKKGGRPGLVMEPVLLIEDETGAYSGEMKRIYGSYRNEQE